MSKNFEKVKKYYNTGIWNKTKLKNAVDKNWITTDEYKVITEEEYE